MINLSDIKLNNIRKTFNVNVNGEIEEVVIFNLLGNERENLKEKLLKLGSEGKDGLDLVEEVYTDVIIECTNIVIDENVVDVLNNPSADLLIVMQEIYDIIHEIQIEIAMQNYQQLCQLEGLKFTELNLLKAQKIELLTQECEKIKKENEEFQKEVN